MKTEFEKCPGCGGKIKYVGQSRTLVGYLAPHDHDDYCKFYVWVCENGCYVQERQQNVCPVEGCPWKGKIECFCSKIGVQIYDKKTGELK